MRKIGKKVVVLAVVSLLAIPLAYAESLGGHGECARGEGKHKDVFGEELGLSAEQKEQIKQHREENKGAVKELHQQLKAKRDQLKVELDKPASDEGKISLIVEEIKALEGQMIEYRVDRILEMKEILTPEQYQKLQEKKESRKKEWMKNKSGRKFKKHW